MRNKSIFMVIFVILLIPLVLSSSFEIQENPKDIIVFERENAVFDLNIKNNAAYDIYFKIDSVDYNWNLLNKMNLINVRVPALDTKSIELEFEPIKAMEKKTYGVNLIIESQSGKIEKIIQITLADLDDVFDVKLIGPEQLDPRKENNKIELKIGNNFNNDYKNLSLILSSDIFSETKTIDLLAKEVRTEEFFLKINKEAQEGENNIEVSFYHNNEQIGKNDVSLKISHYEGVRDVISTDESILVKKEITKKINDGNAISFQKFTKRLSFFEKLFTKTNPAPDVITKEDGSYILTWNLRLEPGEETEVEIVTNYRNPLIVSILVLVVLGLLYYRFKKDIRINKKALTITSEKGISKMKVLLTIRNKGKNTLKNIRIMERVNNVKEKPHNFGTVEPFKINRSGSSVEMLWKIAAMHPKEEIIISYHVKSEVHKIGKLLLPPTLARYVDKGRTMISKSNRIVISK